jgi:hypothetical protein
MKSHGINFVGKLWVQLVPTLPEWTSDDIARLIFVEDENIIYVARNDGYWSPIGQYFRDDGTGIDPESLAAFLDRPYLMTIENGNIILTYDE